MFTRESVLESYNDLSVQYSIYQLLDIGYFIRF